MVFENRVWYFLENRFDLTITNITVSLITVFTNEREFLVATIFNSIAKKFAEKFRERHVEMIKLTSKFVPMVEKIIQKNIDAGDKLHMSNINMDAYTYTVI